MRYKLAWRTELNTADILLVAEFTFPFPHLDYLKIGQLIRNKKGIFSIRLDDEHRNFHSAAVHRFVGEEFAEEIQEYKNENWKTLFGKPRKPKEVAVSRELTNPELAVTKILLAAIDAAAAARCDRHDDLPPKPEHEQVFSALNDAQEALYGFFHESTSQGAKEGKVDLSPLLTHTNPT